MSAASRTGGSFRTPRAPLPAGSFVGGVALLTALAAAGCAPRVHAVVVNASRATLTELRIVGVRDSTPVPDLAPGARAAVAARARGEDELALRGRCGGRRLAPAMAAYAEPGYGVRFTVDTLGAVHVEARAAAY